MSTVYRVRGEVRNTSTGLGVAGLGIELTQGTSEVPTYSYITTSASDGSFSWTFTVSQVEYIFRRPSDGFWRDSVKMKFTARKVDGTIVGTLAYTMTWGTFLQEPVLNVPVSVSDNGGVTPVDPTKPTVLVVTGSVLEADGRPISGASALLKQKKLRSKTLLKTVTCNGDGTFRIEYDAITYFKNGKLDLDVVVAATVGGSEIGLTKVYCSPESPLEVVVVRDGAELVGPTLFDSLLAAITPHLDGVAIANLLDDDLDLLSCRVVQGRDALVRLRQAYRLSATSPWAIGGAATTFEAKAFFAWMDQGIFQTLEALLFVDLDDLRAQIEIARDLRVIPWDDGAPSNPDDGDVARLETLLAHLNSAHDDVLSDGEDSVFSALIAAAHLPGSLPTDFLSSYFNRGTQSIEDFWNSYTGTSYAATVAAFRFALDVLDVVGAHYPLISTICLARQNGSPSMPNGKALAQLPRAQWVGWVETNGVPAWFSSTSTPESKASYVESIELKLAVTHPGDTLVEVADTVPNDGSGAFDGDDLNAVIQANPDLDVLVADLDELAYPGIGDAATRQQSALRIARRLNALVPPRGRVNLIGQLAKHGVSGPIAIAKMGREKFLATISGEISRSDAAYVYRRSEQIATRAVGYLLSHTANRNAGAGIIGSEMAPSPPGETPPEWAELFGSPDACVCDESRSVLSPGAYFSDLLNFEPIGEDSLPPEKRLSARRPELRKIRLGRKNTFTTLPTIDLNIELLEAHLLRKSASEGVPADDDYINVIQNWQTTKDSEELEVHPEHLQDRAYQLLADPSRNRGQWLLPFNLHEQEHETYTRALGTSFAELGEIMLGDDDDQRIKALLGIPGGVLPQILSGDSSPDKHLYWDEPAGSAAAFVDAVTRGDRFVAKTNLSLAQGMELLRSAWVGNGLEWSLTVTEPCSLENSRFECTGTAEAKAASLHRLYRFFRLCRALGWSVEDLDATLIALGGRTDITRETLVSLMAIVRIRRHSSDSDISTILAAAWRMPIWHAETFFDENKSWFPSDGDLLDRGAKPKQRGSLREKGNLRDSTYTKLVEGPARQLAESLNGTLEAEELAKLYRTEGTVLRTESAIAGGGTLTRLHGRLLAAAWGISLEAFEQSLAAAFAMWDGVSDNYGVPINLINVGRLYRPIALSRIAKIPVQGALAAIRLNLLTLDLNSILTIVETAEHFRDPKKIEALLTVFDSSRVEERSHAEERAAAEVLPFYGGLAASLWSSHGSALGESAGTPNLLEATTRLVRWLREMGVADSIIDNIGVFAASGGAGHSTSGGISSLLQPLLPFVQPDTAGLERWHPLRHLTSFDEELLAARIANGTESDAETLEHDSLARTLYLLDVISLWHLVRVSPQALPNAPSRATIAVEFAEVMRTASLEAIDTLAGVVVGEAPALVPGDSRLRPIYQMAGLGRAMELEQVLLGIEAGLSATDPSALAVAASRKYAAIRTSLSFARDHVDSLQNALSERWKISPLLIGEWISGRISTDAKLAYERGETDRRFASFAEPEVVRGALAYGLSPQLDATSLRSRLDELPLTLTGSPDREPILIKLVGLMGRAPLLSVFTITEPQFRAIWGRESKKVNVLALAALPGCHLQAWAGVAPLEVEGFLRLLSLRDKVTSLPIANVDPAGLKALEGGEIQASVDEIEAIKWAIIRRLVGADGAYANEKSFTASLGALATLLEMPVQGAVSVAKQIAIAWGSAPSTWWPAFGRTRALLALFEALDLAKRASLSPEDVVELSIADSVPSYPPRRTRRAKTLALARIDQAGMRKKLVDARNVLREAQRDALVVALAPNGDFAGLSAHLLTDVMVNACGTSSRIRWAMLALQTYLNRITLQLEPGLSLSAEQATQWDWMRRYRVWEAARKVVLYPENWLEPEFRRDVSEAFRELESSLSENVLTQELAEDVYLRYLRQVAEVRDLKICGIYETSTSGVEGESTVHLVGRTRTLPYRHYYRTFVDQRTWTPWEAIPFEISAEDVILYEIAGRLQLAWPSYEQIASPPPLVAPLTPTQGVTGEEAIKRADTTLGIRMTFSERKDGTWQRPKTSVDQLSTKIEVIPAGGLPDYIWPGDSRSIHYGFEKDSAERGRIVVRFEYRPPAPIPPSGGTPVGDVSYGWDSKSTDTHNVPEPVPGGNVQWPKVRVPHRLYHAGTFGYDACSGNLRRIEARVDGLDIAVQDGWPTGWWFLFKTLSASIENQHLVFERENSNPAIAIPLGSSGYTDAFSPILVGEAGATWTVLFPQGNQYRRGNTPFVVESQEMTFLVFPEVLSIAGAPLPRPGGDESGSYSRVSSYSSEILTPTGNVRSIYLLNDQLICPMAEIVDRQGLSALLAALPGEASTPASESRELFRQAYFRRLFEGPPVYSAPAASPIFRAHSPLLAAITGLPAVEFTFASHDPRGIYHWELFLHIPMLIAQRFEAEGKYNDAKTWLEYIFDPKLGGEAGISENIRARYWRVKPLARATASPSSHQLIDFLGKFSKLTPLQLLAEKAAGNDVIALMGFLEEWEKNPFDPHAAALLRPIAYCYAVASKYIENLVAWGDSLFARNSAEAIEEGGTHYLTAARLLGPYPALLPKQDEPELAIDELDVPPVYAAPSARIQALDAAQDAFLWLMPKGLRESKPELAYSRVASAARTPALLSILIGNDSLINEYFCIPRNAELLDMWHTVADRLYKFRNCLDLEGNIRVVPLFDPPIDPALLISAALSGNLSDAEGGLFAPLPHHRFAAQLGLAKQFAGEVRAFGGAILSALEKQDAEKLGNLRARHEINLLQRGRKILQARIDEAQEALKGVLQTQTLTAARAEYYESRSYLTNLESSSLSLNTEAQGQLENVRMFAVLSAAVALIPDMTIGFTGPMPASHTTISPRLLSGHFDAAGRAIGADAAQKQARAGILSTQASYERRYDDWKFQGQQARLELARIENDIKGAEIRLRIAEYELERHDLQVEQSREAYEYMTTKFTSAELYRWMYRELRKSYGRIYRLALELARGAEQCFNYELALDRRFISASHWDSGHAGLLAGEQLTHELLEMEAAHVQANRREYELTRRISLRELIGDAELDVLRSTGVIESFALPEELFNADHPSHYMRRIKTVAVTIPAVTGPYRNVNGTLTLVDSHTRRRAEVGDFLEADRGAGSQSIALSSAVDDSGLFETSMQDPRYLPFEGRGVVSNWKLELAIANPPKEPVFDYATISDVILTIRYTAREGGQTFRQAVQGTT